MKVYSGILVVALVAAPAMAATYSWEDGGTILGSYGNLVGPANVTGMQTGDKGDVPPLTWTCPGAYEGDRYLHVAEAPHSSTPQAYVAWITGLQDGDIVSASIWGWDDESEDPYPSLRIWAHYSTNDDITVYKGSAGAGLDNSGYTTGIGWEQMSSSWEFGDSGSPYGGYESLVIELRLYSSPTTGPEDRTDYWADLVEVTTTSLTATIHFPQSENFGACCDEADCTITTAATCDYSGGEYLGDFTSCDPNPCGPTGSCCSEDYYCTDDLTVEECAAADPGATWMEGGICAVDCVAPTGSCCLMDGSCVVGVTENECADLRGRQWTEDADDCDPACEPAVRAPVIISEYYESAPGYRKALEIFNTSPEPVSLYGHALALYANANTSPTGIFLLDDLTIGGFEAMVFINRVSDDIPGLDETMAIVAPSVCNFNGDDAVAILFGDTDLDDRCDVFAVPGERDSGPRGSDPYKDSAWERKCYVTAGVTEFDSCNFDGLKDCELDECPRGTPVDCLDGANPDEWVFEGLNPYNNNGNHSLGVHAAFCLDIKPGSCPNPFNPGSHGVLPVGLMNTDYVTEVDVSTVLMSRADGVGGAVAPHEGPPGPHSVFEDVATPFDGEPCQCHDLTTDGIDDLSMKFRTDDVVEDLELDDLSNGDEVELVITGTLLGGAEFTSAGDCILIVPPGPANLAVTSNAADVHVDVVPADLTVDGGGFPAFDRSYDPGTVITLTAPASADGRSFRAWKINGVLWTTGQTVIDVTIVEGMTARAVYRSGGIKNPGTGDHDGWPSPLQR